MKINIVVTAPQEGIGGGNRKFAIYFKYMRDDLFNKYFIEVGNKESDEKNSNISLKEEDLIKFVDKNNIQFVYISKKLSKKTLEKLKNKVYILKNVNFTPLYEEDEKVINLIISKTDYWKINWLHGKNLKNSTVVYNPIDYVLWDDLSKKVNPKYRDYFKDKNVKFIVGRMARAEPSKWNFLMIKTLMKLQHQKNYDYGFIFAGIPKLYSSVFKLFLNKKSKERILFLPEIKEHKKIAEFYKSINLFWQTSKIGESFGNVIAEAACFNVPTMTDYKSFLKKNFKVSPKKYDAQIELVDHNINGAYCNYPSKVIEFLKSQNKESLLKLGINGKNKVKVNYDARHAGISIAKICYDYLLKDKKIKKNEVFEKLIRIPSVSEIDAFGEEYLERIKIAKKSNKISKISYLSYKFQEAIWNVIEFLYIVVRKLLIKIGVNLEK